MPVTACHALLAQASGRQEALLRAALQSQGVSVGSLGRQESLAALVSPHTHGRRPADLLVFDLATLAQDGLRLEHFGPACRRTRPETLLVATLGARIEVAESERRWARAHRAFDLWPGMSMTPAGAATAARLRALFVALALPAVDEIALARALGVLAEEAAEAEHDVVARLAVRGIDVGEIASRMRASAGVALAERRYRLQWYANCFVGSEAVDWLVRSYGLAREEAVELGQHLFEHGAIHHVVKEQPFIDGAYFYRFGGVDPKLDAIDIEPLVAAMRDPDGLEIRVRSYLGRSYPSCFVGRDAVDWMGRTYALEREDATALGQRLIDLGLLHHVLDEHEFVDGYYFYRFYADESR